MIKQLTKLANHLDSRGLSKEANYLDNIIRKIAEADLNLKSTPLSTPNIGGDEPWVFNPEDRLGKAILDCSKREAYGRITCYGWRHLEEEARKQRPDLTIPSCGTGWTPEAGFGNCNPAKFT